MGTQPNRVASARRVTRACYCGRQGCLETFLSGPGLSRDFRDATGTHLDPPDIVRLAEASNEAAEGCLSRYEDRLARGLAHVINILDPQVIVRRYVKHSTALPARPTALAPIRLF